MNIFAPQPAPLRSRLFFWILGLLALALVVTGAMVWRGRSPEPSRPPKGAGVASPKATSASSNKVTSDTGRLDAPRITPMLTPKPSAENGTRVVAEGRVVAYPGAEVTITPEVEGRIIRMPVDERTVVRVGDLIAEMESSSQRAQLAEAKAKWDEADSDRRLYSAELARADALAKSKNVPQAAVDKAQRDYEAAFARMRVAAATMDRLRVELAKTRIVSPIAGVVVTREANPGEHVTTDSRIVTIADLTRTRIEAEVDEFDAGRIAAGASVAITAEGYPGVTWRGTVEAVPDAVVARRLRPQDPGRPTDTRVLRVKIAFADRTPLKLSQRVDVAISAPK